MIALQSSELPAWVIIWSLDREWWKKSEDVIADQGTTCEYLHLNTRMLCETIRMTEFTFSTKCVWILFYFQWRFSEVALVNKNLWHFSVPYYGEHFTMCMTPIGPIDSSKSWNTLNFAWTISYQVCMTSRDILNHLSTYNYVL